MYRGFALLFSDTRYVLASIVAAFCCCGCCCSCHFCWPTRSLHSKRAANVENLRVVLGNTSSKQVFSHASVGCTLLTHVGEEELGLGSVRWLTLLLYVLPKLPLLPPCCSLRVLCSKIIRCVFLSSFCSHLSRHLVVVARFGFETVDCAFLSSIVRASLVTHVVVACAFLCRNLSFSLYVCQAWFV